MCTYRLGIDIKVYLLQKEKRIKILQFTRWACDPVGSPWDILRELEYVPHDKVEPTGARRRGPTAARTARATRPSAAVPARAPAHHSLFPRRTCTRTGSWCGWTTGLCPRILLPDILHKILINIFRNTFNNHLIYFCKICIDTYGYKKENQLCHVHKKYNQWKTQTSKSTIQRTVI